jgi:excinuclease ABC subunit A
VCDGIVRSRRWRGRASVLREAACTTCGISYPDITPRLFSFNNPAGACQACDGIGAKMFFDPDLIVPDEELSIKEGAIEPWERRNNVFFHQILDAVCAHFEIDQYVPWGKLPAKSRTLLLRSGRRGRVLVGRTGGDPTSASRCGSTGAALRGIRAWRRREQGAHDEDFEAIYDEFHRYMSRDVCVVSNGTRLRRRRLSRSAAGINRRPPDDPRGHDFLHDWLPPARRRSPAHPARVGERLSFLNVGVDYRRWTARPRRVGGESQRIRLAADRQLAVGVLAPDERRSAWAPGQRAAAGADAAGDLATALVVERHEDTSGRPTRHRRACALAPRGRICRRLARRHRGNS